MNLQVTLEVGEIVQSSPFEQEISDAVFSFSDPYSEVNFKPDPHEMELVLKK